MPTNDQNQYIQLHYADEYNGNPVDQEQGPLITRHLNSLEDLLYRVKDTQPETLAVRFDLHCPNTFEIRATLEYGNGLISLFWQHLYNPFLDSTTNTCPKFHFAWTREHDRNTGQVDYKVLLLLNTYFIQELCNTRPVPDVGRGDNLAGHIVRAWSHALGIPDPVVQLVSFPTDPHTGEIQTMRLMTNDHNAWQQLFLQSSSLCKYEGKPLGRGFCAFRTSNRRSSEDRDD
ncbi:YagK/YfjJ domain-containing protein [Halorhodospira abdelmalekii]|uniref:YagK/YfjJ domain-containing protein n=1 Tax=Halorhodospira abdelmalekii TaxID=421629 RepID=UPI001905A1F2|nr:inovirus-type Gp2 protein [Halorhodospira abdelmalekii]